MYCNACGQQNPDDALFCVKCGAQTRSASTAAEPPSQAQLWSAVIGPKNQDKYLRYFERAEADGGGLKLSWHWPAFFVTGYWLLYRKLWAWAALYWFGLPILFGIVVTAAAVASKDTGSSLAGLLYIGYWLFIFTVPPLVANWLYFRKCSGLVESMRNEPSRERVLAQLEAKGGTSNVVLIVAVVFFVVAMIGILAAVAIPQYADYTKRAKVASAVSVGLTVADQVGEQYQRTGQLPARLSDLVGPAATLPREASMEINPDNGVIEIKLQLSATMPADFIMLEPAADAQRHVSWTCKAGPSIQRIAPKNCRDQ